MKKEIQELKQRLAKLEAQSRPEANSSWRDAFGSMKDDELSREATRLGAEWRATENQRH